MRIAIVTDSMADLPADLAEENRIHVVPLYVIFGEESFLDGVNITSREFFRRLKTSSTVPSTSQPSPASFISFYDRLLEEYDHIFSIHASSKLSGTFQSACIARDTLEKESVEVIDTYQVTMCQGFVALAAARAVLEGAGPQRARDVIHEAMDSARLLFTVDTLEYLARHGRIGKAASMLGTMMSVKPIARIIDGEVTPVAKAYGRRVVLSRVLSLMNKEIGPGQAIHASIVHADSADRAVEWSETIKSEFNCREMIITECGPVVGTHAGPGAIGVAWLPCG